MKIAWDPSMSGMPIIEIGPTCDDSVVFMFSLITPYFGLETKSKIFEITSEYVGSKDRQSYNDWDLRYFYLETNNENNQGSE